MPETTSPKHLNENRAQYAAQAIFGFSSYPHLCGNSSAYWNEGIEEESLTDLLTDMMHLCRLLDLPWDELMSTAEMNFREEVEEEKAEERGEL